MKKVAGVLLLLLLMQPAWSKEDPAGCAWLCGNWVLDAARSENAEPVVDAALVKYREAESHGPAPRPGADSAPPGVMPGPRTKVQVRKQLLALLAPPESLALTAEGDQVLIRAGDHAERRVFPGEPHSRVDAQGTAKIRSEWKKDALSVNESYGRKHAQTETFALLPDGTLRVTLVLERPEAKIMRLRSVYRRRGTQR
jgi:hypothetical protein